jgi:hypothetical protein
MSLLALQRDFGAWLRTGEDEAAARVGQAYAPGLRIYLNNYRAQLVACLESTFARTQAWIGGEAFHEATVTHIDRVPPSGWTLDAYGRDFPGTLAMLLPDDPEVAELAWIEWALAEAFTGPDHDTLDASAIADIDWDRASLRLSPTLLVADLRTNAPAILSALTDDETPPPAEMLPEPGALLVWRCEQVSRFRAIDARERDALLLARSGAPFADLCVALVETLGETEGVTFAGMLLGRWIADGFIAGVNPGDR